MKITNIELKQIIAEAIKSELKEQTRPSNLISNKTRNRIKELHAFLSKAWQKNEELLGDAATEIAGFDGENTSSLDAAAAHPVPRALSSAIEHLEAALAALEKI